MRMKRIHPNASHAAVLAALAISSSIIGCRTPSGSVANPFLAPNRVPPPATRAILPGQAQPYYPGDPLPVMQSNAAPAVDPRGLAWTAPNEASPATDNSPNSAALAFSNEPVVAIPGDNDSLRFALPTAAEPAPLTPVAPSPIQSAAAATPQQEVSQASYSEPILTRVEPPASPWRPPQIAQPTLPPPPNVQPLVAPPLIPAQVAVAHNSMDVRLRAVPSPPLEPLAGSTPRIRLPGEAAPQSASYDGFRPRSSMR
jgi:hypothetical protein